MNTEAWQQRSHSGYYLLLSSFATVTTWVDLEIATSDEAPEPFAVTAACGCILSPELGTMPPCTVCDGCEDHYACTCDVCREPLHAMDDCLACLQEPEWNDAIDHAHGVLGDLGEQVRELS
jgi:hypothetical protein